MLGKSDVLQVYLDGTVRIAMNSHYNFQLVKRKY